MFTRVGIFFALQKRYHHFTVFLVVFGWESVFEKHTLFGLGGGGDPLLGVPLIRAAGPY